MHQAIDLILPFEQAFLHIKRQKIVFFHFHYELFASSASTLIIRLALHRVDLFVNEIEVFLSILQSKQCEIATMQLAIAFSVSEN